MEKKILGISTIDENGAFEIPKDVWEKLDIKEGNNLVLIPTKDGIILEKE